MRKSASLFLLVLLSCGLQAQTWDEWFKQKKTQRRYLAQQIVALQFYLGYLEKGYQIANAGLNAINNIKKGDFHLHNGFFNSLTLVTPSIKKSAAVADIILMQRQIVNRAKQAFAMAKESGQFGSGEISSLKRTVDRMLDDCAVTLEELVAVITGGELEMKDDERIRRIQNLRDEMETNYRFCRSFADETRQLAMHRKMEQLEVHRSRKIFGLN